MAKYDTPLHATCDRLLSNIGTGEQRRVVRGVGVEVQRHVKRLSRIEKPSDMTALILIHIRTSTQHRQSHLEGFPQQALGNVVMPDTFLRKRHQLYVQRPSA